MLQGEVGGFTHRVKIAWQCLWKAPSWYWQGMPFLSSYARMVRKQSSHLVGPSFLALKVFHSPDRWLLAKSADY